MDTERRPPTTAEELLERYAAGERRFASANLRGANLRGADLSGIDLEESDLSGADLEGANLYRAYLHHTDLSHSSLCEARLRMADVSESDFTGANLDGSNLSEANLWASTLVRANLVGTFLGDTNLRSSTLKGADLRWADLTGADLTGADLDGAACGGATLYLTTLANIDLSVFCDASPLVKHEGLSTVDHRAILRSVRAPGLRSFLQRTGMHELFVDYMIDCARSLDPEGVFKMLQSTFISYGGPDTDFAQKLNDALLKNGVTTFFFAKDAIPGKKLHRLMRDGVNQHDRVILICSQASLDRPGVLNEITETLQREARDGGKEYLIPITLDDYVFAGWKPEDSGVAQAIRDRVVADFQGAHTDKAKFDEGVLKLIAALKK